MNDLNNQLQSNPAENLFKLGLLALTIYAIDSHLSKKNDTVNYILWFKKKIVYHGICYEDRMDARLNEHEFRGVKFDEYDFDQPKLRSKAMQIEAKRIRRDRPFYNIHHNS